MSTLYRLYIYQGTEKVYLMPDRESYTIRKDRAGLFVDLFDNHRREQVEGELAKEQEPAGAQPLPGFED